MKFYKRTEAGDLIVLNQSRPIVRLSQTEVGKEGGEEHQVKRGGDEEEEVEDGQGKMERLSKVRRPGVQGYF